MDCTDWVPQPNEAEIDEYAVPLRRNLGLRARPSTDASSPTYVPPPPPPPTYAVPLKRNLDLRAAPSTYASSPSGAASLTLPLCHVEAVAQGLLTARHILEDPQLAHQYASIPRECLADPLAELRYYTHGQTIWPYCLGCNKWSDDHHIVSIMHKKRLSSHAGQELALPFAPSVVPPALASAPAPSYQAVPSAPSAFKAQVPVGRAAPPPPTRDEILAWNRELMLLQDPGWDEREVEYAEGEGPLASRSSEASLGPGGSPPKGVSPFKGQP